MSPQLTRPIAALGIGLLMAFSVAAQSPLSLPTDGVPSAEPEPLRRWLDEVRAQRQIRQERHRVAKETRDVHRRWIDPWGAARQEIREQETQRRHDAFLEHIERDREAFRNQGPWRFLQDPWQEETSGPPGTPPRSPAEDTPGISGQTAPSTSFYPLPGWDNRWYYQGF